jgi:CRP-like cAMP-binding protein
MRPVSLANRDIVQAVPLFRRLSPEDADHLGAVATVRTYRKGELLFSEGNPAEVFFTVAKGRAKVFKTTSAGKDVILEIFGPGDPIGALAVYEGRPFPASAVALEDTTCLVVHRQDFFGLLERHPSLVRGLLAALTRRLVELTTRLAELTGGPVEARLARLVLKLAREMGRPERGGVFIPLPLSRQELADFTGTTVETCIRIMSRWGKEGLVLTEKDGFLIQDRDALEAVAAE